VKLQDGWNNDTSEAGSATVQLVDPQSSLVGSSSAELAAASGAITFSSLNYVSLPSTGF
jgi:hypothetical protein